MYDNHKRIVSVNHTAEQKSYDNAAESRLWVPYEKTVPVASQATDIINWTDRVTAQSRAFGKK